MASKTQLEWNGDELVGRLAAAARVAIDETLKEADTEASASHWWRNRTGNLELNIVTEPAKIIGARVVGRFGTTRSQKGKRTGFYGLFLEYKTPFLRPAADITFPRLGDKIRRRLAR